MPKTKSKIAVSKTEVSLSVNIASTSGLNDEPGYINIIKEAIKKLDKGSGCSYQIIARYIKSKIKTANDNPNFNTDLKQALRYGVEMEIFYINEGAGGSGSYKLQQDNTPRRTKSLKQHKSPAKKVAKISKNLSCS